MWWQVSTHEADIEHRLDCGAASIVHHYEQLPLGEREARVRSIFELIDRQDSIGSSFKLYGERIINLGLCQQVRAGECEMSSPSPPDYQLTHYRH